MGIQRCMCLSVCVSMTKYKSYCRRQGSATILQLIKQTFSVFNIYMYTFILDASFGFQKTFQSEDFFGIKYGTLFTLIYSSVLFIYIYIIITAT